MHDQETAQTLRKHGYKLTAQRLAVLKVMERRDEHLTATEVLERACKIYPNLGLTTVYRTLDLLSELGLVRRVHHEKGCRAYARAEEIDGHYLICRACNRVVDFPCCGLENLIQETTRRTGFSVESHLLELVGLCPACQKTESAASGGMGQE